MSTEMNIREIYLAGGCFWGVEAFMSRIDGVVTPYPLCQWQTENPPV